MNYTARLVPDPRAGRRPAPTRGPRPVQNCPGGCAHTVPVELICCRRCWYRLPDALRLAIHAACRRPSVASGTAVAAARAWFRRQVVTRG